LAALLGDLPVATPTTGDRLDLPIALLHPGRFQPRRTADPVRMAELVESIRRQGVLQPVLVRRSPDREGDFEIIAGERRWRAAQDAGLHEIPAVIRNLSDSEAAAAALIENLQREDLNAIEEADGYERLSREFRLTQEQLAEAVGKSRSHVANMMRLRGLPETVRTMLADGLLSAGHARALLAHADPATAARTVIARGLTVRQAEALARETRPPSRPAPVRDADDLATERQLTEALGLRVQLTRAGGQGSVRIHFSTIDQLDGLVALLSPR
jgi:ParB family chromosome partitioning protein